MSTFDDMVFRLAAMLNKQFAESANLERAIQQNLSSLGFSG